MSGKKLDVTRDDFVVAEHGLDSLALVRVVNSLAVFQVVLVLSLVPRAIAVAVDSVPVFLVVLPGTLVAVSI